MLIVSINTNTNKVPMEAGAAVGGIAGDAGVCEINTHLDVACVLKVPTPLP